METDENRKKRITVYALRRFMVSGVSGVTMDEIARGVGMGKGTVYRLFPSKEALLLAAIGGFEQSIAQELDSILESDSLNPNEKLGGFLQAVGGRLSALRPEALDDIGRNMPEALERIEQARRRIITKNLVRLLTEGKQSGLYDPGMDVRLVAHITIGAIAHLTEPGVLASLGYTPERLLESLLGVILRGCLTPKGRRQFI